MMNPDPTPAAEANKPKQLDPELAELLKPPANVMLFQCDTKQSWSTSRYNGYTGGGRYGNFPNGAASTPTKTEQPDLPWWAEKSTAARNGSARTSVPSGGGEGVRIPARYPMSEWEEQSAWAEYEERKAKLEAEEELLRQQEEAVYGEDEGGMISRMIATEEERLDREEAREKEKEKEPAKPREVLVLSCVYCHKRPLIIYTQPKGFFRVECECGCTGPWGTDRRDAANGWHDAYFPSEEHPQHPQ